MLRFNETEDHFVVTEIILGWYADKTTIVRYTKDLKKKQVNKDPWVETTRKDCAWFRKYYAEHFYGKEQK